MKKVNGVLKFESSEEFEEWAEKVTPRKRSIKNKKGTPRKKWGVDWSTVDWTKSDIELALELNRSIRTVEVNRCYQKKKKPD